MTREMIGLIGVAVGVLAGYVWKSFDVALERSKREWDTRQKILLRVQDTGEALLHAAVQTIAEPQDGVRVEVHAAILKLQSLGAGRDLVDAGDAVLRHLVETRSPDGEQAGKLLSAFADELHRERVRAAKP